MHVIQQGILLNIHMPNNLEHSTTLALWLLLLNCQCAYCVLLAFALHRFDFNSILFTILVLFHLFLSIQSLSISLIEGFPVFSQWFEQTQQWILFLSQDVFLTCLSLWLSIPNSWSYYHAFLSKSTVSIPKIYTYRTKSDSFIEAMKGKHASKTNKRNI